MRRFLKHAYVVAATVALTAPLMQSCAVSLPFVGDVIIARGDGEDDLEDKLDDLLDDLFD